MQSWVQSFFEMVGNKSYRFYNAVNVEKCRGGRFFFHPPMSGHLFSSWAENGRRVSTRLATHFVRRNNLSNNLDIIVSKPHGMETRNLAGI